MFVSQQVTEDGESRTFEETISTAILSQPGKPKNDEIEENNNCKCKYQISIALHHTHNITQIQKGKYKIFPLQTLENMK